MESVQALLKDILSKALDEEVLIDDWQWESGGDINRAASVTSSYGKLFVKWNDPRFNVMFEKEARGLKLLAASCPLKIPEVIGCGSVENASYLVLTYLEKGIENKVYWQQLGEGLAALHLQQSEFYGLDHDNYIGRLAQQNEKTTGWLEFFVNARLKQQLNLALRTNYVSQAFSAQFDAFLDKLPGIMPESEASLLHGDLWSGNAMSVVPAQAGIFDPAVYWGAREMDLAMTRLFGGFDARFYEAYHQVYPIPEHFEELVDVYNLYPLMVHVNLFGPNSGYSRSVSQIINRYL